MGQISDKGVTGFELIDNQALLEKIAKLEREKDEWKEAYENAQVLVDRNAKRVYDQSRNISRLEDFLMKRGYIIDHNGWPHELKTAPEVEEAEKVYGEKPHRRHYRNGKCEWEDDKVGCHEGDPEIAKIRKIAENNYDIVRAVKVRQSMVEEKLDELVETVSVKKENDNLPNDSRIIKHLLGRLKALDDQVEGLQNTVSRYDPNVRLDEMERKVEFHNKLINDYVDDGVAQTEFDDDVLARLDKLEQNEKENCKDHDTYMDRLNNLDNMVGLLEKENTLNMNEQRKNFGQWKLLHMGLKELKGEVDGRLTEIEAKTFANKPVKSMGQTLTEASGDSKYLTNEIDRRLISLEKKITKFDADIWGKDVCKDVNKRLEELEKKVNGMYHPKLGGRE